MRSVVSRRMFARLSLSAHSVPCPRPQSLPVLGPRSCQALTRLGWVLEDADPVGVVLPAASAPGHLHGLPGKERALRWQSQAWPLQGFLQPLSEQLIESDGYSFLDGLYQT